MNILKKLLTKVSLIFFFTTSLYSIENYMIKETSLVKAIQKISEISKLSFIVDTNILENRKSKLIKNVKGLVNTLNVLLEGTDLEYIISNEMIVIRKRKIF